jgi:hypothetical protein
MMEGEAEVQNQEPRGLGFMDLPLEIRQQIYRLWVPTKTVLHVGRKPTCAGFRYIDFRDDGESDAEESDAGESDTGEGDTEESEAEESDPGESDTEESEAEESEAEESDPGECDTEESEAEDSDAGESDTEEGEAGEGEAGEITNDVESDAGDITNDEDSDTEESGDGDNGEPFTSNTEEPTSDVEEAEPWDDRSDGWDEQPSTVVETPPQKKVPLTCPLDSWADDWSRCEFPRLKRSQKDVIHNLCAVSPRIESELLDVFYGENLWFVDLDDPPWSPNHPESLAKHIRQEHRSKIRHLLVKACMEGLASVYRPGLRRKTWKNVFANIRTLRILTRPPRMADHPHYVSCSRALAHMTRVGYFELLKRNLGVIGETLNPSATVVAEILHDGEDSEETGKLIRKLLPNGYLPIKTAYSHWGYDHRIDDDRSCPCYSNPALCPMPAPPCFLDSESEDGYDDSSSNNSPNQGYLGLLKSYKHPNESASDWVSEQDMGQDTDSDPNHDLGRTKSGMARS